MNAYMSFTSHAGRLPLVDEVFRSHVACAEANGIRVCLALQADSVPAMTPYQRSLVESGKVELLAVPKDHGSNTKWTLARAAHPDATLVVVDDDVLYSPASVAGLLERSLGHPGHLVCRTYRLVAREPDGSVCGFNVERPWNHAKVVAAGAGSPVYDLFCGADFEVADQAFPEHHHGCAYPPGFPALRAEEIPPGLLHDDDVLIGALAAKQGVPLWFAGGVGTYEDRPLRLPGALWCAQNAGGGGLGRTDAALRGVDAFPAGAVMPPDWSALGPCYLLHDGARPERLAAVKEELARVGLAPSAIVRDDHVDEPALKPSGAGWSRAALVHVRALDQFLSTGADRCLLVEDDVRFLRSLQLLSAAVAQAPAEFGALRADWGARYRWRSRCHCPIPESAADECRTGRMWVRFADASGDGCTVVSRKCAEKWRELLLDMRARGVSGELDSSDNLLCEACRALGEPLYAANPALCVQVGAGRNFKSRKPFLHLSPKWYALW